MKPSMKISTDLKRKRAAVPKGCGWCKGRPWVDDGMGYMRRCTCEKGCWLAEKDRERAVRT